MTYKVNQLLSLGFGGERAHSEPSLADFVLTIVAQEGPLDFAVVDRQAPNRPLRIYDMRTLAREVVSPRRLLIEHEYGLTPFEADTHSPHPVVSSSSNSLSIAVNERRSLINFSIQIKPSARLCLWNAPFTRSLGCDESSGDTLNILAGGSDQEPR